MLLRRKGREKGNDAQLYARRFLPQALARYATAQPATTTAMTAMTRPRQCHARCHGDSRARPTVVSRREGSQPGGWRESGLGIQAGRKLILNFDSAANQCRQKNNIKAQLLYHIGAAEKIG